MMEDAAAPSADFFPGTVLITGYQSRGRGRGVGRSWEAERDSSMLTAILLDRRRLTAAPASSLTLRSALALALYLEDRGLRPQIKWPNDLLLRGRKVSGIIAEVSAHLIRLGIGMNCLQREFPSELDGNASSLVLEGVAAEPAHEHLRRFLPFLRDVIEQEHIVPDIERRLFRRQERVVLLEGGMERPRRLDGIVRGVQENGALRFEVQGEIRSVYAGEFAFPSL